MVKARKDDFAGLQRVFAHLKSAATYWVPATSDLPLLRRHIPEVVETCRALVDASDSPVALRATILLLAVGEQPALEILEDALLSGDRFRVVTAAGVCDVVPKGPNPALLDLSERVAARSEDCYVATQCVRTAIVLRGTAMERDLATLRRFHGHSNTNGLDGTLWMLLDHCRGPLRAEALRFYDERLDVRPRGQFVVKFFAEAADDTCIPRLWSLLEESAHPDLTGDRRSLLENLVRLKAPGIREMLIAELTVESVVPTLVPALAHMRALLRGTKDQDVIRVIAERFRSVPTGTDLGLDFAQTIAAIGGPETLPLVEQLIAGLPETHKAKARLEARGLSLAAALDELADLGMLDTGQLARAKAGPRRQTTLSGRIIAALEAAGALLRFDSEYSATPVPHDRLIQDLAAFAGSDFAPASVVQEGPEEGAAQDAYTVTFEFAARRYQFRCGDQSDWFGYVKVADTLNAALAEAGVARRFVELEADGQLVSYLFVAPESAREAGSRGLLVLHPRHNHF